LPDDDASPITNDLATTDPLEARFVEVTTAPLTHLNTFLRAVSADEGVAITTQAAAGRSQIVRPTPPMTIRNPAGAPGRGEPVDIDVWRGRQVILTQQGGVNSSWAPGNFGYLEVSAPGANALRDALASINGANDCYGPAVTTEPGAKNGARNALNVRF